MIKHPELDRSGFASDTSMLKGVPAGKSGTAVNHSFWEKALDTTINLVKKGKDLYHTIANNSMINKIEDSFFNESSMEVGENLLSALLIAPPKLDPPYP